MMTDRLLIALQDAVIAGWAGLFPRRAVAPRVLAVAAAATAATGAFAAGHLLWS